MYSMLAVSLESLKICIACGIPQRDKHATLPVQPHRGANGDLSVAVALEVVVRLLVPAARHGQCQLGLLVTRVPFVLLNDLTFLSCSTTSHHACVTASLHTTTLHAIITHTPWTSELNMPTSACSHITACIKALPCRPCPSVACGWSGGRPLVHENRGMFLHARTRCR